MNDLNEEQNKDLLKNNLKVFIILFAIFQIVMFITLRLKS